MPSTTLVHADIFFFVSTIALVVIAIGVVVALVLLVGVVKNVKDITDRARTEWEDIVSDSQRFRASLRDEGLKWKHVAALVRTFFVRDADRRAKRRATVKDSERAEE